MGKKECGNCNGTGKCQVCKGTGRFGHPGIGPVDRYPSACNTCQGSGDCRACKGTGQRWRCLQFTDAVGRKAGSRAISISVMSPATGGNVRGRPRALGTSSRLSACA